MQLSPQHQAERERFIPLWNRRSADIPALQLDKSWPSVGVFDLLTLPLIGKQTLLPREVRIVRAAALYLAEVIGTAWEAFGVEAGCLESPSGVLLQGRAAGGISSIELEKELTAFLKERPTSFQVYSSSTRQVGTTQGWMGAFAIGCCAGLSPAVRGAWEGQTPETFAENIEKVLGHLGRSVVNSYERLFPDELIGQVGELYLHGGVIPPLGIGELFPAVNGSTEIYKQLRALRISKNRILAFAENLAALPDEHLSSIGAVLCCALIEEAPSERLIALSERFGRFSGLLRKAVAGVRSAAGLSADWLQEEHVESRRIEIEKQLGFLPWLQMPGDYLARNWKEKRLRKLCEALSFSDYDTAVELCDILIGEEPREFEIRLQRIYLSLINKKIDEADNALRLLISEPECESEPRLYSLWGVVNLQLGDREEAARHFSSAYSVAAADHPKRGSIANDYGWLLMQQGRPEEALALFAEAKQSSGSLLTVLLNELAALSALGRAEEYQRILAECCSLAPLDKRVFGVKFLSGR